MCPVYARSKTPMRSRRWSRRVVSARTPCPELTAQIRVGMNELEIARLLELIMGRHGAADRSFDSIVATGPHSAIPHHQPTLRPIAAGDLLKIDFGALYGGYHADCTRTFIVAADPQPWQVEIHAVVAKAQQAGIDALRRD